LARANYACGYSREGANVTVVSESVPFAELAGPYDAEGFVRQAFASLTHSTGNIRDRKLAVDHTPCGLSVREDASPITGNYSRFLPHAIV
jgi:glutathionylspermidine synthase